MPDNVGYTPGSGVTIAADEINNVLYQRVKPTIGDDGVAVDVSVDNPMPSRVDRTDNLLEMMARLVKILESNATVDSAQRQRITLDAITGALTLATVTTVGTVSTITGGTITTVSNITNNAGMDREQYINIAKQTYTQSIRNRLEFT